MWLLSDMKEKILNEISKALAGMDETQQERFLLFSEGMAAAVRCG